MKSMITLFLLLFSSWLGAQNDCACDLKYVINYYETNLPGFKDNVNAENLKDYEQLKKKLQQQAALAQEKVSCFKVLTYYVEFFKDNHSGINMSIPNVDENDPAAVQAFLNSDIYQSLFKNAWTAAGSFS